MIYDMNLSEHSSFIRIQGASMLGYMMDLITIKSSKSDFKAQMGCMRYI